MIDKEELLKKLQECFKKAVEDEKKGLKHKGLILTESNTAIAKEYIRKARESLEFCDYYKKKGTDYKILEEWFYSLYYCALAILSKFGVESRSQRYTGLFIQYLKLSGEIIYDDEFIESILVHSKKGEYSEVDEREEARYGHNIKIEKVSERYDKMMGVCNRAIEQCEQIIYSLKQYKVPKEIIIF
jgi:hypothetical protein